MISAIMFVNLKGELVISRWYRDNVSKSNVEEFRTRVIGAKKVGGDPIIHVGKSSFLYTRVNDVFMVAVTKQNANPTLIFQYMFSLLQVFTAYFGGKVDETQLRNNFVLIYELLDETMDNGYPQITAVEILKTYIYQGNVKLDPAALNKKEGITSEITGAVDWRQAGKFHYKKNEVYIDVLEAVNLLMSAKGSVLRSDVSGKVMMKTYLSGMPECKFGMNDKLVMDNEGQKARGRRPGSGIAIDDVTFHRCVKLGMFDHDRTISFVPPDGEFELMKYRITQNVNLPFRVIPVVSEHGRSRVEYEIKVKGNFSAKLFATNVILKIPCPKNTAKCTIQTNLGKAKYNPGHNAIIWKMKKFAGMASATLKGEVKVVAGIEEKQWSRPPITMEFQVPMFTSSGLHVRFLKVFERENYPTTKWVRYMTRAGQYQIRI